MMMNVCNFPIFVLPYVHFEYLNKTTAFGKVNTRSESF